MAKIPVKADPAFVKDVLGATRYRLFKAGKLSLASMVVCGGVKRLFGI